MEIAGKEMKIVTLDHLGIVAATCKDLGLEEKINTRLHSNDPRRIVSPGKAILAMILNGLGFSNRRLYLTTPGTQSCAKVTLSCLSKY